MIGNTCSTKTTCQRILQHSLTELRIEGAKDNRFQLIKSDIINPKSKTVPDLFGYFNYKE
jgi:hypothetical protein